MVRGMQLFEMLLRSPGRKSDAGQLQVLLTITNELFSGITLAEEVQG